MAGWVFEGPGVWDGFGVMSTCLAFVGIQNVEKVGRCLSG